MNEALLLQTTKTVNRKEIKVVKSIYAVQPIIDEVVWESGNVKLGHKKSMEFSGEIDEEPGIYLVYGHLEHFDHEILQRKVEVQISVFREKKSEDNQIQLHDIMDTFSPRIATRFIVSILL